MLYMSKDLRIVRLDALSRGISGRWSPWRNVQNPVLLVTRVVRCEVTVFVAERSKAHRVQSLAQGTSFTSA